MQDTHRYTEVLNRPDIKIATEITKIISEVCSPLTLFVFFRLVVLLVLISVRLFRMMLKFSNVMSRKTATPNLICRFDYKKLNTPQNSTPPNTPYLPPPPQNLAWYVMKLGVSSVLMMTV